MKCPDCGRSRLCRTCRDDNNDYDETELTTSDVLAYERYKERADFDYWHRFDK